MHQEPHSQVGVLVESNRVQAGSLDHLYAGFREVRRWISMRVCPRRMSIFTSDFTSDDPLMGSEPVVGMSLP